MSMVDIEILQGEDGSEIGFIFKMMDGSDIQPQIVLDSLAELFFTQWGHISPMRKPSELDS